MHLKKIALMSKKSPIIMIITITMVIISALLIVSPPEGEQQRSRNLFVEKRKIDLFFHSFTARAYAIRGLDLGLSRPHLCQTCTTYAPFFFWEIPISLHFPPSPSQFSRFVPHDARLQEEI